MQSWCGGLATAVYCNKDATAIGPRQIKILDVGKSAPFIMLLSTFQIGCLLLLAGLAFLWARSQWRRLPPGPPGLPFLGNIADMPKDYEWRHWAKHKDIYGTSYLLPTRVFVRAIKRHHGTRTS
jgi:hypothetical protein